MAVNIGPKIGIDGEAEYRKSLKRISDEARLLDSEMKKVTSSFDENDKSQENLNEELKVLGQQMDNQRRKIELLGEYQEKANQKLEDAAKAVDDARKAYGDNSEELQKAKRAYEDVERAVNNTKIELNKSETAYNDVAHKIKQVEGELDNLEDGLADVDDKLEDGEKSAFSFGDALKANLTADAIKGFVSAMKDGLDNLIEGSKEYQKIMGSLDVSSKRAGYSAEDTQEIYKQLYGVLADDQTAATTTANLQAIGLAQEDLAELTNATIGAWATYGDSIPIDGLAESVNETIKAGQVTGTFADVLNWASLEGETFGVKLKENTKENEEWNKSVKDAATAEDYFNLALEQAGTNTERANIVLKMLKKQGLADAGKAWRENNKELVEANEATSDFQDSTAKLAKKFSPISTSVQKGFNRITGAAIDMVEDVDIDGFIDLLDDGFGFIEKTILPAVKGLFDFIIDNKGLVVSAIGGVGAAFTTWKVGSIVSTVIDKVKALSAGVEGANGVMKLFNGILSSNPAGAVAIAVGALATAIGLVVTATQQETEEEKLAREALEKKKAALEESVEAYKNARESAIKSAEADLTQIDRAKELNDELQSLADEKGNVAEKDKARAKFILGELNKALGTEYEMTGNQIKQYQKMQDEIKKTISTKRAQIMLEAQEKIYLKAIETRKDAEEQAAIAYREMMDVREEMAKRYPELLEKYDKGGAKAFSDMDSIGDSEINVWVLKGKENAYKEYQNTVKEVYQNIGAYEEASVAFSEGKAEETTGILEHQNTEFRTFASVQNLSEEEQTKVLKEQYQNRLHAYMMYKNEYEKGTEGYTKSMLETLRKSSDDAKAEAKKAGINTVDGFTNSLLSEAPNMNASITGVFNGIRSIIEDAANKAKKEGRKVGENTADGFTNAIQSKAPGMKESIRTAFNGVIGAAMGVLQIHSPSRVFEKLGELTGEGFEIGMTDSMEAALKATDRQLKSGIGAFSAETALQPFSLPLSDMVPANNYSRSVTYGDFSFTVVAQPGMDEHAIADAVMQRMQTEVSMREAVFG